MPIRGTYVIIAVMKKFDVMVIGAGSAGRYGAKAAAALGARVGLVETGPFGGLCILKGCMPTKAYLRSAEMVGFLKKAPEVGVYPGNRVGIRFDQIKKRKDRLIAEMADDAYQGVIRHPNITLLSGKARFLSKSELQVGRNRYSCDRFLIATGSKEVIPSIPGLKEAGYLTSDTALEIKSLPASMVIIGGGVEGVEFGQFFNRMGVKVTLLQRSVRILSHEDDEVGEALGQYLRRDGIDLLTDVHECRVEKVRSRKRIYFESEGKPDTVEAEAVMMTTGRTGNIHGLRLEEAGVESYPLGIRVNDYLQTSNPNIYAAGDVTGILQVVNLATSQGEVAGANLVNGPVRKADYRVIPRAVFTDPEYARVGLSEGEAKERGIPVRVGRFPFNDLGKAIVTDQMEGFIKIVADPDGGEILGVQILGAGASNLIHQATVAMHYRATLRDYAKIVHIHPTMAEIMLYLVEEMIGKE
ncbi:MAG TPA: NAD(P)/FAD-dependent oxidoreductase [Candidatus Manganitrophaceae bacterium]|nr:NAD(P)/FAD-dependent oxidoreductase [Candidatus Manganitrophaceae bacterium]